MSGGDSRNLIVAVLLSALVLIGWTMLSQRLFPPSTKVVAGRQIALPNAQAPAPSGAVTVRDRAIVLRESPRVPIATPRLAGSIDLRGARIDDLVLVTERETIAKDSPPIRLLSPSGAADSYFAGWGWSGEGLALPGPDTVWAASGGTLVPGRPVTLHWDNGHGQRFEIVFAVDDAYMFTVTQRIANAGTGAIAIKPYALIAHAGVSKDPDTWTAHTGPIGVFNGAANYDVSFANLDGKEPGVFASLFGTSARAGENRFHSTGGWIGFSDKYWLTALVPAESAAVDAAFRAGSGGHYQADVATAPAIVPPGAATAVQTRFFAGGKEVALLDRYERAGVPKFDRAIDWGWFYWFERPIFWLLDLLFKFIGNFGVAILLLTCIIRALMFPVAQKQFASMAGMRVVQPKLKALQERYKDDKERLQKEMMELYKREKVNPLAGCLPIVIQIPIFYALYKVLMLSLEMRHQPFAGWLRDLSAPDPLTPLNLFGLLAFTPPHFLAIGVLPILLGCTMWLQFKLNPAAPDPVQQQMFSIMPWLMMFFFAPLAAGLQLYYVMNNLLSLAQQRYLYSRHPSLRQAPAK